MNNRTPIRTVGLAAGTVVLMIVLFLVAGISTGFLPWRDSYAENPWPPQGFESLLPDDGDHDDDQNGGQDAGNTPGPLLPTVTPTPTPTPEVTPTPTPTPVPTPTPTPGISLDEELPTYTITVTFSRGGTAIPYGINNVVQNGMMSVVAVPDEGYVVEEMIVDGMKYEGLDSYVFENVNENHSVYISFTRSLFVPTPTPNAQEGEAPELE